jgi:hypothetical protein
VLRAIALMLLLMPVFFQKITIMLLLSHLHEYWVTTCGWFITALFFSPWCFARSCLRDAHAPQGA